MKTRVWLPAMILMLSALTAQAQGPDSLLLRYKFQPEQTRSYDFNLTGGGRIAVMGSALGDLNVPLSMLINGSVVVNAQSADAQGNGRLRLAMGPMGMAVTTMGKTMHMELDLPHGTVTVDGKITPLPHAEQGEALSKLTIVTSPRGQVLGVEGVEAVLAALKKTNPLGAMGAPLLPDLSQLGNNATPQFPEGPVRVGDSWTQTGSFPVAGTTQLMPLTTTYTLDRRGLIGGREMARIALTSHGEVRNLDLPQPPSPILPRLDLMSVDIEGQMYFDPAAGAMHSTRVTVTINMTMSSPPVEGEPGPQVSIKNLKLYVNITPRGEESGAAPE
ncbi:MAG TPA: hypothetical protein VGM19_00655 [Armatimonadota bacterium]|jgi:hypothetical protein